MDLWFDEQQDKGVVLYGLDYDGAVKIQAVFKTLEMARRVFPGVRQGYR